MALSLIVAHCNKNGIGCNGEIPWYILEDLQFFKYKTLETESPGNVNAVIMGRKTFDSLNRKPLKGRINVVISRCLNNNYSKNVLIFNDFNVAVEFLRNTYGSDLETIYTIGGTDIYRAALNRADLQNLYITEIENEFTCDTYFPDYNRDNYVVISKTDHNSNGIRYKRYHYQPKS